MRIVLALLCLAIAGCVRAGSVQHLRRAEAGLFEKQAELTEERAALLRQYRECLKRSETDPTVDCSDYRTAIEVPDSGSE